MDDKRDEHNLIGQTAGIVAMMSALVKTLPPSTRKRLLRQTQAEFESLLAAMSTTNASRSECEVVEWLRDLFLKRIAQADSKQKSRKVSKAAENPGRRAELDKRPQAIERRSSTDVDFEL
jgi:hypothetical protein